MKNKRPISEMADEDFGGVQPRRSGFPKGLVTIILVVIIVLAVGYAGVKYFGGSKIAVVSNDWQAIFLVNGQVYFGQVKDVNNKNLVLKNIYYLQVVSKPLQGTQAASAQQEQELTLVKLGNEIHGPQDNMIINTDQILLTERLKNDSKVVAAINDYIAKQKSGQNQAQTSNPMQTK